jgi:hypothetical protein
MVAYLDSDDEYYPDYLQLVARFSDKADVLIFAYDTVVDDSCQEPKSQTWLPSEFRHDLFARNVSTPLGVSHRTDLIAQVGGFNTYLWNLEDWELWKRLARTGAQFIYLPFRSGIYHIRSNSISRRPKITPRNYLFHSSQNEVNAPIYGCPSFRKSETRRILYASARCYLDDSPGSMAASDMLSLLARLDFTCEAFSSSWLTKGQARDLATRLVDLRVPARSRPSVLGSCTADIVYTRYKGVPVTIVEPKLARPGADGTPELYTFACFYEKKLDTFAPDAILTHGGDYVSAVLIALAKRRDITVIFLVNDMSYRSASIFSGTDYCICMLASQKNFYWNEVGLSCHLLPYPIVWDDCLVTRRRPERTVILEGQEGAGRSLALGIAERLASQVPPIPAATTGPSGWVGSEKIEFRERRLGTRSLRSRGDPDNFFARIKLALLLTPDDGRLLPTTLGSMVNGIPVLAAPGGMPPGILGDLSRFEQPSVAGDLRSAKCSVEEEAGVWTDAVVRLWNDPVAYKVASARSQEYARVWQFDKIGPIYRDFFGSACPQPGFPLVVRQKLVPEGGRCGGGETGTASEETAGA